MTSPEPLIPKHGGYRKLKTFQIAQVIYDVTVRFCELYVDKRSRTNDQMVQAARSGVQNIAEGSQASGTSKKSELKLTNVGRASLEELRLDYEDYLRQRELPAWPAEHPALQRFKARRCASMADVRAWMREDARREGEGTRTQEGARTNTDIHGPARTAGMRRSSAGHAFAPVGGRPCSSGKARFDVLAANAALSLLNLCCHLLDRQLASLAEAFQREGGFTERLYRTRRNSRA